MKIKRLIYLILLSIIAVGISSCKEDDKLMPGSGITNAAWQEIITADLAGQTLIYEFTAGNKWTATSDSEWCHILTPSGYAGLSSMRVKVAPNADDYGRKALVTIKTEGFVDDVTLEVRQGEGFLEKGDGRYRDVNEWIYDIMEKNYLWNDSIPRMMLDYSVDYQQFLSSMVNGLSRFNDVNHDDGYWVNGQRQTFYSYIESNAPLSRSPGDTFTDSGIRLTATILGTSDDGPVGLAVLWVIPGSPGDVAGVKRGDFINKVNGIEVTRENYSTLGMSVMNGNSTVQLNDVKFNNDVATVTPTTSVIVGKDSYVDPAIYRSEVVTTKTGKKVGYLLYMGFNMDYDDQLLEAFSKFRREGAEELIIDLRFNNGGHLLSSTVLATLIAGNRHKGEIYTRTTYNKTRTEAGEIGEYFIGESKNPEMTTGYDKIPNALNYTMNLNRVYVITSANTASASELLINGLRGVGIEVNLIGTKTNGKNVGMEGYRKRAGNYNFDFFPITFYCENAKGFKDYSDGFIPELEFDDSNIYPGDFCTDDQLSSLALSWASTGIKPTITRNSSSNYTPAIVLPASAEINSIMNNRIKGLIQFRERF